MKPAPFYQIWVSSFTLLVCLLTPYFLTAQTTRYVKSSGMGNGSSWANASSDLQGMINASASGDAIWVAAGTYLPSQDPFGNTAPTDPRDKTFYLKDGVKIYGGFAGTETDFSQRDFEIQHSILSGDIGAAGVALDNCYHVVLSVNDGAGTELDGLRITGGYARNNNYSITVEGYSVYQYWGGGMLNHHSSPLLKNCEFYGNSAHYGGGLCNFYYSSSTVIYGCLFYANSAEHGGGMFNYDYSSPIIVNCLVFSNTANYTGAGIHNYVYSSPNITNCYIYSNTANSSGGGIFNEYYSSPNITNCYIYSNTANDYGGGMWNHLYSSPNITNCYISSNTANFYGGGISNNYSSSPNITNCLIFSNVALEGGGIWNYDSGPTLSNSTIANNLAVNNGGGFYNTYSSPTFQNCIIWGNTGGGTQGIYNVNSSSAAVSYSVIQGGYAGANNLNTDPLFANPSDPDGADNIYGTADDGFNVQSTSLAIDAGNAAGAPATDITGFTRIGLPDIGAYEHRCLGADSRVYIKPGGTGDGSSWTNAAGDLEAAINDRCVVEVWVAAGTYTPAKDPFGNSAPADPRNKTFYLRDGIKLYGGFAGTETDISQRNITAHPTILSGDLGVAGAPVDNCYHVVLSVSDGADTELDGFTVSDGNADGTGNITVESKTISTTSGAGLFNTYTSLTIRNCRFINNQASTNGGGMYNEYADNQVISNCVFANNTAWQNGGGLYSFLGGLMAISNSSFLSNTAVFNEGGAIYFLATSFSLSGCTFNGNTGGPYAAGVYSQDISGAQITNCVFTNHTGAAGLSNISSTPVIQNCTFVGNTTGIHQRLSNTSTAVNCIIWGNGLKIQNSASSINISYSIVQGGYAGTGNINADPLFANVSDPDGADNVPGTTDDGLRLLPASPAINAGSAAGAPEMDITGFSRAGMPDIGAYEYNAPLPVEWLRFTGENKMETNYLYWTTAQEQDCRGFDIERSADGVYFEKIGFVQGVGNSHVWSEYEYIDTRPLAGINYYRLQQLDFSGHSIVSNIIQINHKNANTLSIYPNPGQGVFYIQGNDVEDQTVSVVNALGQTIELVVQNHQLDLTHLPSGVYLVSFMQPAETLRILKQ